MKSARLKLESKYLSLDYQIQEFIVNAKTFILLGAFDLNLSAMDHNLGGEK